MADQPGGRTNVALPARGRRHEAYPTLATAGAREPTWRRVRRLPGRRARWWNHRGTLARRGARALGHDRAADVVDGAVGADVRSGALAPGRRALAVRAARRPGRRRIAGGRRPSASPRAGLVALNR